MQELLSRSRELFRFLVWIGLSASVRVASLLLCQADATAAADGGLLAATAPAAVASLLDLAPDVPDHECSEDGDTRKE